MLEHDVQVREELFCILFTQEASSPVTPRSRPKRRLLLPFASRVLRRSSRDLVPLAQKDVCSSWQLDNSLVFQERALRLENRQIQRLTSESRNIQIWKLDATVLLFVSACFVSFRFVSKPSIHCGVEFTLSVRMLVSQGLEQPTEEELILTLRCERCCVVPAV